METSRSLGVLDRAPDGPDDRPLRGVGRAERGRPGAERAVDRIAVVRDVDAVLRRPDERADDRVGEEEVARAAVDARLDDRQLDVRRDADDPLAVRLGRDDPGHVRAVAGVVVPGRGILVRRAAHAGDAAPGVDVVVQVRDGSRRRRCRSRRRVTFGLPPVIAWASGAWIRCEYHWKGENVSSSTTGQFGRSVRRPSPSPSRTASRRRCRRAQRRPRAGSGRASAAKPGSSDSAMTTSICG